jgi:adenylate kinase
VTTVDRDTAGGARTEPLRVAVTGTPGTGKSTGTEHLEARIDAGEYAGRDSDASDVVALEPGRVTVVHLNDVIEREGLYDDVDEERDSVVVDLDALAAWVDDHVAATDAEVVVLDSHLAHHLDVDRVAVLRCRPETLEVRLTDRGEPAAKAEENAESEALDVVLGQSVDAHGTDAVYEIATTDADPDAVADAIASVLSGARDPSAGTVDYIDYL